LEEFGGKRVVIIGSMADFIPHTDNQDYVDYDVVPVIKTKGLKESKIGRNIRMAIKNPKVNRCSGEERGGRGV